MPITGVYFYTWSQGSYFHVAVFSYRITNSEIAGALQCPLASAYGGHAVQIAMVDGALQGGHDLLFPCQEIRAGQVCTGNGVVRDKGTITVQILHEDLELSEHFLFGKRGELPSLGLLQQRRAGAL